MRRFAKRKSASRPSSNFLPNPAVSSTSSIGRVGWCWLKAGHFAASQGQSWGQPRHAERPGPRSGSQRAHAAKPIITSPIPARTAPITSAFDLRPPSKPVATLRYRFYPGSVRAPGKRRVLRVRARANPIRLAMLRRTTTGDESRARTRSNRRSR